MIIIADKILSLRNRRDLQYVRCNGYCRLYIYRQKLLLASSTLYSVKVSVQNFLR